jgi:FKBP-type peptidyl-prolyl cis-trans isomerase
MKKRLMFLALAAIGLASCNGGFKNGPGGMVYKIIDDKSGPSIQPGDYVSINYIIKTDADSLLASSYETGQPSAQVLPKSQFKGDILAGLALLSEGDSAVIKTNIDSLAHGQPRQKDMKGKYVVYTIKVEKVIAKGNLSEQVFEGRCEAYKKTIADAAQKQEPVNIEKYIKTNNVKAIKTDSGLYYQVTKEGTGAKPVTGDTVVVNYTLKLISGKAVETSVKSEAIKYKMPINPMNPYKPIRLTIGALGMIKGWDQGMQLLNKGSKAILIVPSKLAYGERGNGGIGPYTPLVFEIELVDIIHPDPNAPKPKQMMPMQPAQAQRPVKR